MVGHETVLAVVEGEKEDSKRQDSVEVVLNEMDERERTEGSALKWDEQKKGDLELTLMKL